MVISAILPAVVDHTRLVHLNLQDRQVRSDFKVHYFETHLRTCPTIRVVSDPAPRQRPGQAGVVGKGEVVLASVECAREGRKVSSSYTTHLEEKRLMEMKDEKFDAPWQGSGRSQAGAAVSFRSCSTPLLIPRSPVLPLSLTLPASS